MFYQYTVATGFIEIIRYVSHAEQDISMEEEVLGKPVSLLVPEGREDEVAGLIARVSQGEEIAIFETVRRRKDGAEMQAK